MSLKMWVIGVYVALTLYSYFTLRAVHNIAADIKVIRATCTQQAK
jgi:hypothetical protein